MSKRMRAPAWVVAFSLSLVWVAVTPHCTRDRVVDTTPWVAAVSQARGQLHPDDVVLVHPPWRDDVVAALRASGIATATTAIAPRAADDLTHVVVVFERDGLAMPRKLRDTQALVRTDAIDVVRVKR